MYGKSTSFFTLAEYRRKVTSFIGSPSLRTSPATSYPPTTRGSTAGALALDTRTDVVLCGGEG